MKPVAEVLVSPASQQRSAGDAERDIVRWLANELALRSHHVAIVVVGTDYSEAIQTVAMRAGVEICTLPDPAGPELQHLPEAHFDRVYVFRYLALVSDKTLQSHLHRILNAKGEVILMVRTSDFSFAPLPAGGDLQLIKRTLAAASFDAIRLEHRSADFVAVSARRKSKH